MIEQHGFDEHGRWRCSLAARERADQRVGTAVPAPRWFLVGHPGPWPRQPQAAAGLVEVAEPLMAALGRAGARLQLVRRHRRPHEDAAGVPHPEQPVMLVDSRAGTVGHGTWREPADLVALAERFDDPPERSEDPVVLVCAHGRRDVCCAIEGRVVAAVLDDVLPGAVWETTHLGGDRFAANVAYLPEGSMFGGLDGSTAPEVLLAHIDGRTDLGFWRGRSTWTSQVQAAVADVLREPGLSLPEVTGVGQRGAGADAWMVTVDVAGVRRVRRVTRTLTPPRRLTCQAGVGQAAVWHVAPL